MLFNLEVGAIVSIIFINRVLDQHFGCKRLRGNNTLEGNGVSVESIGFRFKASLHCIYDGPYDSNPLVTSGLSLMIVPWSSTGGLIS